LMKGGDWGDDVRLDRVNRNRANGRDSESRHRQFGERFHCLFLRENTELGVRMAEIAALALHERYGPHAALQLALCCAAAMRVAHKRSY
jgi:hypothetical protein